MSIPNHYSKRERFIPFLHFSYKVQSNVANLQQQESGSAELRSLRGNVQDKPLERIWGGGVAGEVGLIIVTP